MKEFYPEGQHHDPSYARIINKAHFKRVKALLDDRHGGEIVMGGLEHGSEEEKLFPTTEVKNPSLDSRMMSEEIFGPVLPVLTVGSMEEAISIVNSRDHPLGLYIFSSNSKMVDHIIDCCPSGGTSLVVLRVFARPQHNSAFHKALLGVYDRCNRQRLAVSHSSGWSAFWWSWAFGNGVHKGRPEWL